MIVPPPSSSLSTGVGGAPLSVLASGRLGRFQRHGDGLGSPSEGSAKARASEKP